MNRIAREYALDVAEGAYAPVVVAHLPGIANTIADSLSSAERALLAHRVGSLRLFWRVRCTSLRFRDHVRGGSPSSASR